MPVLVQRRSSVLVAVLILSAIVAIVPSTRADGDPADELLETARDAMIQRDYVAAETVLSRLIRDFPSTSAAAEGRVLRGRALVSLGKTDEAVRDLAEAVASIDESSVWRRHARFLLAEVVSASGKTGESATIYLDEARSAQSQSSRDELAARFEALADEFSRKRSVKVGPLVETIEADYGTAATLFGEALRMAASRSADARLIPRIAESHFLGGNFGAAIAVSERFFEGSPDRESDVGASALARMRYVAGRAYLKSDRAADARRVFEALANSPAAQSDEFADLEIWIAESIVALGIGDASTMLSAIEHYDRFLSAHPTHPRAEEVLRAKIDRQTAAGLSSEAEATCRTYLDRFARQPAAPGVLETIAELRLSRNEHDAARAALTEFLEKYPDDARVPKIQARLPEVMLLACRHAVTTKNYDAAIEAFRKFLETYPAHPSSPNAAVEIGRLQHRLGQFDAARRSWSGAQDRYRESDPEEASTAGFLLGALIEETDKKLAEAAEQYRRVAEIFSGRGGGRNASLRLSALTQEVLELEAPKIVATCESPTVRLTTRNIPSVVVKVHRLDLGTYFRAKHRTEGFEDLDTTLIRPDSEWKYEVPNYEPYRSESVALPIKLPPTADSSDSRPSATAAPGCYLVTVDDGKRKSLAALIVSDIRLIVKSSARQIFVAAIDVSAKTTVEGVEVLVSDGRTIVAEGKTGADGVFARDFAASASDRRVLAVLGRHATPGCVAAAPPETTAGYLPKVRVATDRAVYLPGDEVRYRLLARAVDRGDYKVPPSGETLFVKFMNAGRVVDEAKVTLNRDGSADGTFKLSPDAPLGEYSVETDWTGSHFSAAIAVKTYTKPSIVVGVKVPTAEGFAVRPGDEVASEVDVADFFGAPIADARIRWSIFETAFRFDAAMLDEFAWYENAVRPRTEDEPSSTGRLIAEGETIADLRGRAAIKFRTNSVGANEYVILARAETEDLSPARGVGRIVAAPQSFFGLVKTDRRAYRLGDKMTVDLSTVGPDFFPVASSGELFLLARETGGGERVIAQTPAATGPNGRGTATFVVPEAGRLSLRYDARGKWGERVVIRTDLDVSAEAFDPQKDMRVVAERKVYREGETVNALLEAPQFDLPVLVTFEADRVIDYAFHSPASLTKTLSFDVKSSFGPSVFLSVAGFSKGRFFSAVDEIVVLRWLDVGIEVTRPSYRPGEKAEVRLTTRDPLGRPVAAEVAVSAVDRAVVSLGGPRLSDVRGFFYDRRRRHGVAGSASTAYFYRGQTTPIDVDLLAVEKAKQKSSESEDLEKLLRDAQNLSIADDAKGDSLNSDVPAEGGAVPMGGSRMRRTTPSAARPAAPEAEKKNADRKATAFAKGSPFKDAAPGQASADAADFAGDPASGIAPLSGAIANGSIEGVDDFERRAAKERHELFDKSIDAAPALNRTLEPGAVEPRDDAVRTRFADLAFFDAHVATDADGRATISIDLPDNLTQWIVTAEGATRSTLVGSASSTVVVKKEIETSIVGPRFLTHKDRTTMRAVATDRAGVERKATITPTIDGGDARLTPNGDATLDFGPYSSSVRTFDLTAEAPGQVTISAQTTSADAADKVAKRLPILAAGAKIVGGTSGILDGKVSADFTIDEDLLPGTGRCEIWISRGIDQDLFEAVLWLAQSRSGCIESNIGRFEPAARMADVFRRLGIAIPFSTERLDALVRSGVESLAESMNADGGFGWWKGGASDLFLTAAAVEALHGGGSVASKKRAESLEAARLFVLRSVAERRGSLDAQAYGLYALSLLNAAPGEEINRLVRSARDLGTMGQAWICLAAGRSGRDHQAEEVVKRIESALDRRGEFVSARGTPHDGWVSSSVEATAWALRALLDRGRRGPTVDGVVAFLRSKKHGPAFGSTKETAAVIDSLVELSAKVGSRRPSGEIAATVNTKPIKRIRIESAATIGSAVIDVPADLLLRGQNRVEIESTVGEALNFSVLFEGTAVSGDDIAFPGAFRIERRFSEYVPLKDRERRQKPGYSIIREESRPAVDPPAVVAEMDLGMRSTVRVEIECVEDAAYVVIEDPLCAGVDVFEETVRGPHDRFERRDDRMVFYMSAAKKGHYVFEYGIVALYPGEYFVNPPSAFEMYDPRSRGRGVSSRLGVRSRDVVSARVAPPARTPDEVYAAGHEAFLRSDWNAAVAAIAPLCDLDLRDDIRGAIMLDLLIARLRNRAFAEAVRDHQSLSTLANGGNFSGLTANDVLLLGDAYRSVGDFEMAKSCAAHVLRERFTAELLHTRYMERAGQRESAASAALLLAFASPSERAVLDVWAEASEAFFICARRADPAVPSSETTEEVLKSQWERGLKEMRRLLSHAEPTFGDDFGRRYLERLREVGRTADLEREAKSFLERRPESVHASDAQLMVMKASFLRQDWAAAESAARALTDRSWPTVVDGRIESRPSRHRPEAEHILGRIAHVRGDVESAVAHYAKVKDLFADAAQSYAFFVEKRLELPALCEFAPGEECTVPVDSKNVGRLEGALYGVDLPVVFAVRKSMTRINQVELTGISADRTIESATGAPAYRDHKSSIALGKPEEGAYLLVIGDGARRSTSLVIVSSLKIDLQRVDRGLRCWVTKRDGSPVSGAEVRIGDGRRIVGSGRTDERGIISFGDIPAGVTALATSGRSFALRRD